jgi:hypothetical protein
LDVNIATQTGEALYGGLEHSVNSLYDRTVGNNDVPITADSLNDLAKALVAYSLDPLSVQAGISLRYGILPRLDGGYHYFGGAQGLDLRWQFLGPLAADSLADGAPAWQASVAAQFSWQSFDLPSIAGLDKLQDLLGFEFTRKDILIPLIFGKPFGQHGRYGSFAFGGACDISFIRYGSEVLKLVERKDDGSTAAFAPLHGEKTIASYGGFADIRAGYRWVYLVGSFSAYWQDYGTFALFGGRSVDLEGWTVRPAAALEFRF